MIIGDAHFSEHLGYYHVIPDGRSGERQEILDFIIKTFEENECDSVVFLGDQFDKRNNPSIVIKEFTKFIERFSGKPVYMISGNHDKTPAGDSALDYLKEITNKNWHIITDKITKIDNMVFCPYLFKAELGGQTNEENIKIVLDKLKEFSEPEKNLLFTHFSISGVTSDKNSNLHLFDDIILPRLELEKYFKRIFAGHIHAASVNDKTLITGCVFNEEVGEHGKAVYIYNTETNKFKTVKLPGRGIYKVENPKITELEEISKHNIVKAVISNRKIVIDKIREELKRFDGYIIVEQYPNERRKVIYDNELLDLNIENLLLMYAKLKKIEPKIIIETWNKIK